ncbi:MAG: hypothetical protein ACD_70C00043G0001 [uncultured bacterium]|nr:MAG: hypothetical protein ACD_70C00043G0001 [uncultured bacterium]OGT25075.1 MAG: hypothetical protein A3B71_00475 [Gammaproteobacteria bacterium RIFCSPHIGHO2_02_FULL_42_43]OGT53677.1 MAG: hypothetical protein A3E54_00380 [Gammaproteobacteria bacterium RIFCSPHIGHO2_12_FULL_41_25]OGT62742.1 MAG: hypothetical protein A3I77_05640 [Gammaproteobacteria bacterium RIFCSPLOWO2_02_FULL_42_14]OGT85597.1 MAG: hypothetical protein A3G86_02260 [Gammaproteobacteria bacterium RIFCSPLOWO2_12_FULL_42_18]
MRTGSQAIKTFFITLVKRFADDQCAANAASLAYTTLLSIVPLLLFVFYVLSFFPQLQHADQPLEQFILNHFVASSANVISSALQSFLANMGVLSWTNVISLAAISLVLIFNIVSAINTVWHVQVQKYWALSFIVYCIFVLIAPILLAILLMITSYVTSLPMLATVLHIDLVKKPLFYFLPMITEWVAFSFFHWVMPSTHVQVRFALIAGLLTTILFELAKFGFVQYLHYFPTYQMLYGALATIPIFLVWIYLSWLIVILGALVCNLLQMQNNHL